MVTRITMITLIISVLVILSNEVSAEEDATTVSVVDRLHGGDFISINNAAWMVLVYKGGTQLGYGSTLNADWVITTTFVAATITTSRSGTVYTNIQDFQELGAGKRSRVVETILHPNANRNHAVIALLKCCPTLKNEFITIPPASTVYATGTTAYMYRYQMSSGLLLRGTKRVGPNSQCTTTEDWDDAVMFCLAKDSVVYGQWNDVSDPIEINNMLAGVMTEPQLENYAHGEQILDFTAPAYRQWIFDNTGA